jgi:hypothetical protein
MSEQQKASRFQELRERHEQGNLNVADQAELANLTRQLEAGEAAYLRPAAERLRKEREAVETQNRALEVLVQRQEALAQRLHAILAEAQTERRAIKSELAAVLAGSSGSETTE